ncbi:MULTISPECIES: DUF3825 domain-containing protein [unclassified Streptomyces]|uniref:DUF3825 domain-containing protein n=1 Tax=unclassified Streptomyces TaxID=2593676 RepID=UPI0033940F30
MTTQEISPSTLAEAASRSNREPSDRTGAASHIGFALDTLAAYASLGRVRTRQDRQSKKAGNPDIFERLERMAESENWGGPTPDSSDDLGVLKHYVHRRFDRAILDEMVLPDAESRLSVFNSGLVTARQEDIYDLFVPNSFTDDPPWHFRGWHVSGDQQLSSFPELPAPAAHSVDPGEYFLDWNRPLRFSAYYFAQLLSRQFPKAVREIPYGIELAVDAAVARSLKMAKRNPGTAVPSWNHAKGEIQLLLPMFFTDPEIPCAALSVSRGPESYQASEVISMDRAYRRARLVARPCASWLTTTRECS